MVLLAVGCALGGSTRVGVLYGLVDIALGDCGPVQETGPWRVLPLGVVVAIDFIIGLGPVVQVGCTMMRLQNQAHT
jgi:hypothetical protein